MKQLPGAKHSKKPSLIHSPPSNIKFATNPKRGKYLKVGQTVKVFEDPLTELKLEGEAVLVCYWGDLGPFEVWDLKFIEEEGNGIFCRRIKKK